MSNAALALESFNQFAAYWTARRNNLTAPDMTIRQTRLALAAATGLLERMTVELATDAAMDPDEYMQTVILRMRSWLEAAA